MKSSYLLKVTQRSKHQKKKRKEKKTTGLMSCAGEFKLKRKKTFCMCVCGGGEAYLKRNVLLCFSVSFIQQVSARHYSRQSR